MPSIVCKNVRARPREPLFTLPDKSSITYKNFQIKLRQLISSLNRDPKCFSSNSFRRGGCTFAFNIPSDLTLLLGDWKSDAYRKYLSLSMEDKLIVDCRAGQRTLSE